MKLTPLYRVLLGATVLFSLTTIIRADNWPQWRGPHNDGVSNEKGLPSKWSETTNVAWKLTLPGKGSSTPIIWNDRIFLTGSEGDSVMLWCVSTDGKMVWKKKVGPVGRGAVRKDEGNDASSTPTTDGKQIYVFFGTGDFAAFDFQGNQIWHFNVQERYKKKFSMYHGVHVTPILHDNRLYMNVLHTNGQWVFAVDAATGNEIWKIDRPTDAIVESKESYASPVLWKNGNELNLVVLGADYTTGHRLTDGKELWRLGDLNPKSKYSTALRIIASPLATGDQLYVPTARGGLFVTLKQGAEGSIRAGSKFEAWRTAKGAPDVPCPLYHDGILYLQQANGVMLALDAKSGREFYNERITGERYRSSPIYADGKIYTIGRDSGTVTVLKAGPKLELLGTNVMSDNFTGSPAVSNGRLYLRGFGALYAISEGGK